MTSYRNPNKKETLQKQDFKTLRGLLVNILDHEHRFRHRASKVRQIFLRGSNFGLRFLRAVNRRHETHVFPSLPKEAILRIFTPWKNPSTLAGIEPAILGSKGEHDNHWTTGVGLSMNVNMTAWSLQGPTSQDNFMLNFILRGSL